MRIANTGGPGVLTTGNGILVVDATNGTTTQDAFALAGEARGGALSYFLFRGGLNGSEPESWFLRDTFSVLPENGDIGGNGSNGGIEELPGGGIEFPTDSVPLLEQATRLEFAGGLSAKILPGLSLYARAGYQVAVSGTDGVKGDFGMHYTW